MSESSEDSDEAEVEEEELSAPVSEPEEEAEEESEGRGPRRPRRRRRRTRRRSEESVVSEDQGDVDDAEVAIVGGDDVDAEADNEDEEVVVPVSYEGIPSWEEAISYLQRRPRDSRQRGDGSRRSGPQRR